MVQRKLVQHMNELAHCSALSYPKRVELQIAPNEVLFWEKAVILKCKQSDRGEDFAVSENGLMYGAHEQERVPGVQGYVLLVDLDGNYVNQTTPLELRRKLNGVPPRPSDNPSFGPYFWVDGNFNYVDSGAGRRNYVDQAPW